MKIALSLPWHYAFGFDFSLPGMLLPILPPPSHPYHHLYLANFYTCFKANFKYLLFPEASPDSLWQSKLLPLPWSLISYLTVLEVVPSLCLASHKTTSSLKKGDCVGVSVCWHMVGVQRHVLSEQIIFMHNEQLRGFSDSELESHTMHSYWVPATFHIL